MPMLAMLEASQLVREVFHLSIYSVDSLRQNYLIYCPCDGIPAVCSHLNLSIFL